MMMSKLFLVSFVLVLSGCATQTLNPWDGLTTETTPAATPLDCGSFPLPTETHSVMDPVLDTEGQPTKRMNHSQLFYERDEVVYDLNALNDLNAYRVCSEANEAIAGEHAKQITQLKIARKGLTEAGRAQRNIADMREEMLDDERKRNFFEKIGLYVVIGAMGFAL